MNSDNQFDFDRLRNLTIGTVDYVSPNEIKVMLDTSAPQNTALNTGTPTLFPRINGFVLIPNENGSLVGLISWIGVEHSQYPKQKGYKDFDLIDLPFPLRKMSVTPMGTLKQEGKIEEKIYKLERGVYSFPSIGDSVILPTDAQLRSIVENKEVNSVVRIGTAPIAANAEVRINPDKLFGRHIAILGNTGSGKSCSVAGVIRWSLEEAIGALPEGKTLNSRFIILDPNGEYTKAFDDLNCEVKKFKVEVSESEIDEFNELEVPAWLWNSYEWGSIADASGKVQRPILKQALRELRSGSIDPEELLLAKIRRFLISSLLSIKTDLHVGPNAFSDKPGRNDFGKKVGGFIEGLHHYSLNLEPSERKTAIDGLAQTLEELWTPKFGSFVNDQNLTITYFNPFSVVDLEKMITVFESTLRSSFGDEIYMGNTEDDPVYFNVHELPQCVEAISEREGKTQFVDFLTMRIRTMLSDNRMNKIIADSDGTTLDDWLAKYIGGISIIDLSLVPSEITHLVIAVISRIVFEALQRYRKLTSKLLPTVLIMEEAHNFIKRYNETNEELSTARLCTQSFEKIAREGRKFGLSLCVSSQRPSELSPTVLSQCNTFLLHRIVNDKDQELVGRLVPDNIGGLLKELPILPTRKAILLGWATSIPILVEMRELKPEHRPKSEDPDFWDVWTRKVSREVEWKKLADSWQNVVIDVVATGETTASSLESVAIEPEYEALQTEAEEDRSTSLSDDIDWDS